MGWSWSLPDMESGQHGGGPAPKYPDSEEDDEEGGGEHHLPCVRSRIPDGQGECHRPSQAWSSITYTNFSFITTINPHGYNQIA